LALRKRYVNADSPTCIEPGCNRKGKWEVSICGFDLVSEEPMTRGERERLCDRCGPVWRARWDEFSHGEVLEAAA
jgi:hypothetical protein